MSVSPETNTDVTGVVIRGYDPVAYFLEGRPVPGKSELSYEFDGGKYLFSSSANRDAFKANSEAYAPQYGGYCAFGVAMKKKFDIDPASWRIVDGKLYFNLNPTILDQWLADSKGNIRKSEKYWPMIRDKQTSEL
jgi:YHS domain-containing protein